jgi:predicted nucleic acid-binding protein
MDVNYFLDTYAIYEMLDGNPHYDAYVNNNNRTSIMNIAEIYYRLLLDSDEKTADEKTIPLFPFSVIINPLTVKNAMIFRLKNKTKKMSYVDCIGYQLAKEHNLKFLTGDKEFEGLPNVEFVK